MVDNALVGRCGIYCGACGAYRAYKDKDAAYLQKVAQDAFEYPLEKMRCKGCHALTPNCAGSECKIVKCLDSKDFEYCCECPEYEPHSCQKYENLAKQCTAYGMDLRANLNRIRTGETEAWLKESEQKFKCPCCGKPLPVFGWKKNVKKVCYHCEGNLSK